MFISKAGMVNGVTGARNWVVKFMTTEVISFWVMARPRPWLGDGMTEVAWKMALEKKPRTKRHKWVVRSPRLTGNLQ